MTPVVQALLSIASGVFVVVILAIWRRVHRAFTKFERVLETVETFGNQWTAAATVAETIRSNVETVDALKDLLEGIDQHIDDLVGALIAHDETTSSSA